MVRPAKPTDYFDGCTIPKDGYSYYYPVESGPKPSKIFNLPLGVYAPYSTCLLQGLSHCDAEMILPVPLGVSSETGLPHVMDLSKAHTLVAGTTGFGKSTFLNNLILSLAYANHPSYLKLVVIDYKRTDFKHFHPITTLVNEFKGAVSVLQRLDKLLDERMARCCSKTSPPNIRLYNEKVVEQGYGPRELKRYLLPYVLVLFDEYVDFFQHLSIVERSKKIEVDSILFRLATLGRGFGIILLFSMQAPYAEYLPGPIKNNFTNRFCFKLGGIHQQALMLEGYSGSVQSSSLQVGCMLSSHLTGMEYIQVPFLEYDTLLACVYEMVSSGMNFSFLETTSQIK